MENKIVWKHRDKEWIKNNPGKPTMYKDVSGSDQESVNVLTDKDSAKALVSSGQVVKKRCSFDSGVYVIICENEKCVYVGQSSNVNVRLRSHKMCMLSVSDVNSGVYILMSKHVKDHGIDNFVFKKYISMPHASEPELLKMEVSVMSEFIDMGYDLYNRIIPKDVLDEVVFCPKEHKETARKFIKELLDKELLK